MKTLQLITILLLILVSCTKKVETKPQAEVLSSAQLAKIDSICKAFVSSGTTVGLSLGLSHKGEIVFSKGYGLANIASNTPVTDTTIFPIASVSKFITAVLTQKMIEEGKLSLSDRVVDYIPDFPKQEFMNEITIEHLLRHQSGLVDHEDWFDSIYIHEKRVFLDLEMYKFLDQPLFFRPGSKYSYSNSGYAILSSILEGIEQKSFHEIITEKLSKPYRLESLGMWQESWHYQNTTMGYELTESSIDTSYHMMTKGMKGDGGLSANIKDLLRFMNKLTQDSIISKASLNTMLTPTPIGDFTIDYGLGVKFGTYANQNTFGHSGGYKGTTWAMLMHYPDSDYTFAAAINTNYSPEEILYLRHLIMPIVLNLEPPTLQTAPINNLTDYTGTYSALDRWGNGKASVRVVKVQDGNLFWDNPDTEAFGAQLFQLNDSLFTWKPYPFDTFKFHKVNGKVVACSEYYDGMFGMVRIKTEEP